MSFATLHDLPNNAFLAPSIAPAAQTATINGAGVDCTLIDGPVNAISNVGAATGSPTSYTVTAKLQESADNSNWTDIVTQSSPGAQTAAGSVALRGIREKQYVRVVQTIAFVSGTSPTIATSATIIGQLRKYGLQPGDAGYGSGAF